MKRFTFRLQRILELREAKENAALADLGREQQKLNQEHTKLELFHGEETAQIVDMRSSREQPFPVWMQSANHQYLNRLGRVIEFQTQRVHLQSQNVEFARLKYFDKRKDTRVLEQLREKKHEEWTADVLREEGNILDEVGSRPKCEM